MLAVLGGLADVERDLTRTRTAEGRNRAKARRKHMGRPSKLTPQPQKESAEAAGGRCHAERTGRGLQCRARDDFAAHVVTTYSCSFRDLLRIARELPRMINAKNLFI